jgi:hypothetical protein
MIPHGSPQEKYGLSGLCQFLIPPVTRTLLPGTKEVYGQFRLLDFNQPELQPFTAYGQTFIIAFLTLKRITFS